MIPEHIAQNILIEAVNSRQASKLLDVLFAGGSVTMDNTGQLVFLEADLIEELAGRTDDDDGE